MSQSERFTWTEPVLHHYNYDLKKAWFVYYSFTDHLTGQTKRCQERAGINRIKNKEIRIKAGNALVKHWKEYLSKNYNPFTDSIINLPSNYRLTEALDKILAIKLPTCKKRTKETYSFIIRIFKEWLKDCNLSHLLLKDFTSQMATQYMDYLIVSRKYCGRTHNDHLIVLKTFMNEMIDRDWLVKHPFKKIAKKPVSTGRNIAFSEAEKELVKNYLYEHDRDLYFFSQIMYYCYIRRSELAQLRIGDIDLVNKVIVISSGISKNKKQETVVIPVGLESVLNEMELGKYPPHYFVFGRKLIRSEVQYINYNHISTRHTKHTKAMGISEGKGLYSWKHSGVCMAYYSTGKDIYSLMRQLRHTALDTTQIYLKSLGLVQNDIFRTSMIA